MIFHYKCSQVSVAALKGTPLFFEKKNLNKTFLFMWSLDRLSVDISIGVRMNSIGPGVSFLSDIYEMLSSKKSVEKSDYMIVGFCIINWSYNRLRKDLAIS